MEKFQVMKEKLKQVKLESGTSRTICTGQFDNKIYFNGNYKFQHPVPFIQILSNKKITTQNSVI